uniref:Tolloid protein n=1 Tax=Phallusia mammillata TaxID=59560 RepID=A0A6F9D8G2_9ASCI|nr:Tolloid protein [Phallusia mammillata]
MYSHRQMCFWYISVDYPNKIGILLLNLGLESHNHCSFDLLKVSGIKWETSNLTVTNTNKICGRTHGISYIRGHSNSSSTQIQFQSDSSFTGVGFYLVWFGVLQNGSTTTASNSCSSSGTHSTTSGYILSPGFPSTYPAGIDCHWVIQTLYPDTIAVYILYLDLETSNSSCGHDWVEIFDGNTSIAENSLSKKLCHTHEPVYQSTQSSVFVEFHSNAAVQNRGFHLTYSRKLFIPTTSMAPFTTPNYTFVPSNVTYENCSCPTRLTSNGCGVPVHTSPISGYLFSSNLMGSYSNNQHCTWLVSVENINILNFILVNTSIERQVICLFDWLLISGVAWDNSSLVVSDTGRICGRSSANVSGIINSSLVQIEFKSDSSVTGAGFHLIWFGSATNATSALTTPAYFSNYTACEGGVTIRGTSGKILFPADLPSPIPYYLYCSWTIEVPTQRVCLPFSFYSFNFNASKWF